ncbi:hypothetical protein KAR91_46935 [Candidatus Pacearchaeota archaeon]|nr:hypothetical protein [Candidatus Pacearchaeota archaeon]
MITENTLNFDVSSTLTVISDRVGEPLELSMLSTIEKNNLIEISKMLTASKKMQESYDRARKKISAYIFIFFICFITVIETMFFENVMALLISLIIGVISYILIQKEKRNILQTQNSLEELEGSIEKKTSTLVTNIKKKFVANS